jgi:hypothetical protein
MALRFGPRQGSWQPWWKEIQVTVHGLKPTRVTIPDQPKASEIMIGATAG